MNPQDPLANLHPLRQPELIGWWPPAIGWWLLLCAVLLGAGLLVYLLRKHHRKNAYRRRAALQLRKLCEAHQPGSDVSQHLGQINALLKSAALVAYPRIEIAAQHGETWRQFLNRSLPPDAQLEPTFDTAMYQQNDPHIDLDRVQRAAQLWIKRHKAAP